MPMLRSLGRTAKARAICGSDVLMMAPSRFCMKNAAATIRATRRAAPEVCAAVAIDAVAGLATSCSVDLVRFWSRRAAPHASVYGAPQSVQALSDGSPFLHLVGPGQCDRRS